MMKKLAIGSIAAAAMAVSLSLPSQRAYAAPGTTVVTTGPVNPQGTLKPDPFADVPTDHWAYNAVEYLRQNGLTEGYPDKTYRGKRPMTRYEFAMVISRMVMGLMARIPPDQSAAVQELRDALAQAQRDITDLKNRQPGTGTTREDVYSKLDIDRMLAGKASPEDVRRMIDEAIRNANLGQYATKADLQKLQDLVNEFRNELNRLGVDVDALKKGLKDLQGRVEAIEAELARMPKWSGDANLIGKTSWKSNQVLSPISGALRPVLDHDARPMRESTNVLQASSVQGATAPAFPGIPGNPATPATVLGYYDLDLAVVAHPTSDVRVGAVVNVGNYLSSYPGHGYDAAGPAAVTPYKLFVAVPFRFLGSDEVVVGRLGTQLTPYTFKAIDPDTYTYLPREDSGEAVLWGINTTWRFGGVKARWFAGIDPMDGRLLPLNVYPGFTGIAGGVPAFGNTFTFGGGYRAGSAPISTIANVVGVRLSYGEGDTNPARAEELPVGTAAQTNLTMASSAVETAGAAPTGGAAVEAQPAAPAESGLEFGPFRNVVVGLNYLLGTGRASHAVEDARANVYGADARFKIGPIRFEGEAAWGQSLTGRIARPRALNDSALDFRGFWDFGLGSIADLQVGGGWRRITLDYLTPGYWGILGSWKNPRGIEGPLAEIRVPLKKDVASFLRNVAFRASAEFYEGAQNVATVAAPGAVGVTDPDETNLKIDRYLAGVQFGLTSRDNIDLGVEQVFRNYVPARATDLPLNLNTMGIGGSPLVGTRIKNTETYINFGIGHNFTPDVAVKLLYQLVDFGKFAVDRSNQPANYRGYVGTVQLGVRF